jgi:methyl-accepting chemotaxis protein
MSVLNIKRQSLVLGVFILFSFMALQFFIGSTLLDIHHDTEKLTSYMQEKEQLQIKKQTADSETLATISQKEKTLDQQLAVISAKMNNTLEDKSTLYFILFINVLINLGLYLFSNRIVHNLSQVKHGLDSFFAYLQRKGDSVKIIEVKGHDEFADIAKSINENIKEIGNNLKIDQESVKEVSTISQKILKGDFSQRISSTATNPEINQLKETLNTFFEQMQTNLSKIVDNLISYQNADYKSRITLESEGELKALIEGVNALGKTLESSQDKIENSLTSKSNMLNTSAEQLQSSVKNLFKSIEVEKNNSQEVSSQMQTMNEKIKGTVQKAKTMKTYAKETTQMAQSGELLADKTFQAMQEINSSTESINEAITAIDSIAFQTNILSLNAAVEAATAGDAGKGFAVVAQEVRNLAAKSAEAAKSIKELVENTQTKAHEGMQISEDMKKNFAKVNSQIEQTYTLVDSVAQEASSEEEMVHDIKALMREINELSTKNSEVAKNTDSISSEILSIARDLRFEVDTAKEKVEV